jgi:hypothetical protein
MNYFKGLLALYFFGTITLNAQELDYSDVVQDTIFKLGRGKIVCVIKNIGSKDIRYFFPEEPEVYLEIERKQVQKIIYGSGKIEEYNKPLMAMIDENSWEAVWVTEKEEDVQGLHFLKKISIESESSSRSMKAAKNNAYIRLKKKAAGEGAQVALIKAIEAKGGYGEWPSYYIEAELYSWNAPPAKEE